MKKTKLQKFFSLSKGKNVFFLMGLLVFWWVFLANVEIGSSDVFHDRDQDGLSDEEEYMYGTDINNPDSDGDGYKDGVEVESGYDPLKPAPGDKLYFQKEDVSEEQTNENQPNLTDDFFDKLKENKGDELDLLSEYYTNPDDFSDEESFKELNSLSLTSDDLQNIINQTTEDDDLGEMSLIPEDEVVILDKPTGSEKKVFEKEKEQIEKYLTQVFYVMSVNKPFAIEDQQMLAQIGVGYISEINGAIQTGQTDQLKNLKEKAQKTYEECLKIETPYVLKDVHVQMLSIIKYLTENIKEEKLVDQEDPMTLALYAGKLQAALIEGENLKNDIDQIIEKYGIEIFKTDEMEDIF